MVYNSIDEIFAALATTRWRIYEQVADLSDEQAKARSAPDLWSVAEIIEHLSMAEGRILALLGLRPRIEATDYSHVTYPHPVFGPLNLYQWLAAAEFHECKHLDQIQTHLR